MLELMPRISFVDQVRAVAKKCDLTQRELANRIGIGPATFSRFLAGTSFLSEQSLNALAKELGLQVTSTRTKKDR